MRCGRLGHFPRGQVLATFQCDVPHCQPLLGWAEIGTEGCGMPIALRGKGGRLAGCWELTALLAFWRVTATSPSATVVKV